MGSKRRPPRPRSGDHEFASNEAGDNEEYSGDVDGLTREERLDLETLTSRREMAIVVLPQDRFSWEVSEDAGTAEDDAGRARARTALREDVVELIRGFRSDGLL